MIEDIILNNYKTHFIDIKKAEVKSLNLNEFFLLTHSHSL